MNTNEQELYPIEPGQLRGLLQPILFGQLTAGVEGTPLEAGDWVGLQFWGEGRVLITRVRDSYQVYRTARQFKVAMTPHDIYGGGTQRTKMAAPQLSKPKLLTPDPEVQP